MPPAELRSGSVRSKLIVNTILAVAFIAISAPQATRIPAHEWLSLAFIGILALHILFSWSWIVGVTRRFLSTLRGPVRFNYVLDSASYLAMVVVMVSGIVISEAALPSIGFPRPRDRFWSVLHDLSSEALLVMIGVHLAMHWDWVVAATTRVLTGTLGTGSARTRERNVWLRPALTLTAVSVIATLVTLGIGETPAADRLRRPGGRAQPEGGAPRNGGERLRRPGAAGGRAAGRLESPAPALPSASDQGERAAGASTAGQASGPASGPASGLAGGLAGGPATARVGDREAAQTGEGKARPARREGGGGGTLTWRQRYLRPTLKIGAFMGVPFLLTLALLGFAKRRRSGGGTRAVDPLEQRVD